jgi:5'(3')-deoxyribonucleotidase
MTKDKFEKKRLFVDMDGTLFEFRPDANMEELYAPGYFKSLAPYENVISAIRQILRNAQGIAEVFSLSAYPLGSRFAVTDKNAALDEYLPKIDAQHRIFLPCGMPKNLYVPGGIQKDDFLLDDYTVNLIKWQIQGRGIKILNPINHTNGTWENDRIRYDREPGALAEGILAIMRGAVNIYDDPVRNK